MNKIIMLLAVLSAPVMANQKNVEAFDSNPVVDSEVVNDMQKALAAGLLSGYVDSMLSTKCLGNTTEYSSERLLSSDCGTFVDEMLLSYKETIEHCDSNDGDKEYCKLIESDYKKLVELKAKRIDELKK